MSVADKPGTMCILYGNENNRKKQKILRYGLLKNIIKNTHGKVHIDATSKILITERLSSRLSLMILPTSKTKMLFT